MKKIAVGLSGGVDSAVAAMLLKNQGHEVVGVHLICWPPKSLVGEGSAASYASRRAEWIKKNGCRADEDRKMALKTALELAIPFQVLDFSEEYSRRVVDYFYAEYEAGRTPNPDVLCNSEIKFGLFMDWALASGFDYVATGHYAKLKEIDLKRANDRACALLTSRGMTARGFTGVSTSTKDLEEIGLFIPKDKYKDQTYFLWKLTQRQLKHVLFPLGDYLKSEVREMAKKASLSVADRKDSQGICFIGEIDVREFIKKRLQERPGRVLTVTGEVIGEHRGVWFYTIGQRGGWQLTAMAQKKYVKEGITPIFYVVSKDAQKNELVVGFGAETFTESFWVSEVNWITSVFRLNNSCSRAPDKQGYDCARITLNENQLFVRIRHGRELIKAKVARQGSRLKVELIEAQRGVAPGQSAVFYLPTGRQVQSIVQCLGGGVIE